MCTDQFWGCLTTKFNLSIFLWLCNRKERRCGSWVFVPIFHCQLFWKFSTMSICALPLWAFVDFQIRDLRISKARICGDDLLAAAAGRCHTQPLLYRWISMSEYLPWIFVNKQHEYPWTFVNICLFVCKLYFHCCSIKNRFCLKRSVTVVPKQVAAQKSKYSST